MKVLHFADSHLREYGKFEPEHHLHGRTLDYLESMDYMIDAIIEDDVDLVIFAGDAFHSHNPNQNILYLYAQRIAEIAEHCPIVMIPGNHDMPGPSYRASSIDVLGLEIPNVIIANEYKVYKVSTKSGDIQIGAFPYPMRQHILSGSVLKRSKTETWGKYKAEISKRLQELAGALETDLPSILLGHFTISGAVYGSERPMILDKEAEIDLVELVEDCPWNYIALGHIHKHQVLWEDPPVVYAGSLDRIDFSEEKDSKGWELIDIQGGSTTHDFCVNVMSRHLLTLEINVLGDDSPMPKIISEIKEYDEIDGTIVRMIIECDSELFIDKNQISQLLDDMGMYELHSIQLTVPREYHSRLDSDKPASAYTVMEMMDIYFEELEDDEWDEVIELAEEIMGEVIDD